MKRKLTDKELRKRVRTLEAAFRSVGKTVVVVEFDEMVRWAVKSGLKPILDQSGNGRHLWPMPQPYSQA